MGAGARTSLSTGTRQPVALGHTGRGAQGMGRQGHWVPGATPPHGAPTSSAHGAGGLASAPPSSSVDSAQTLALAG